jgi:hypothetical protein
VQGKTFAAIVPLQQGQNTITTTAADIDGLTAQAVITINTQSLAEQIRLTVNPNSGIPTIKPDGTTSFDATLEAETYMPSAVVSYSWDINGDGVAEQSGASLAQVTAKYQNSGLYFPTVTVTDAKGNAYTETTIVNVLDRTAIDAFLKAKWEGMKTALVGGNIEETLNYFTESSKEMYRYNFTLMRDILPLIVQDMASITMRRVRGRLGEYEMIKTQDGITYSYYIEFIIDADGIWKVNFF